MRCRTYYYNCTTITRMIQTIVALEHTTPKTVFAKDLKVVTGFTGKGMRYAHQHQTFTINIQAALMLCFSICCCCSSGPLLHLAGLRARACKLPLSFPFSLGNLLAAVLFIISVTPSHLADIKLPFECTRSRLHNSQILSFCKY